MFRGTPQPDIMDKNLHIRDKGRFGYHLHQLLLEYEYMEELARGEGKGTCTVGSDDRTQSSLGKSYDQPELFPKSTGKTMPGMKTYGMTRGPLPQLVGDDGEPTQDAIRRVGDDAEPMQGDIRRVGDDEPVQGAILRATEVEPMQGAILRASEVAVKQSIRRAGSVGAKHSVRRAGAGSLMDLSWRNMFTALISRRTGLFTVESCCKMLTDFAPNSERDVLRRILRSASMAAQSSPAAGCGSIETNIDFAVFVSLMENELSDHLHPQGSSKFDKHLKDLREALSHAADNRNKQKLTAREKQVIMLEILPGMLILLNGLIIGYSADMDPDSFYWNLVETVFCFCFTVEAIVRFSLAGGCRRFLTGDDSAWNVFDVFCLCCAYTDLAIAYGLEMAGDNIHFDGILLLKLFRLIRVCRLVRMMRFGAVKELRTIIEGIVAGISVLAWAIALLFFTIYVVAISARILIPGQGEFADVSVAMMTVFRCFTDGCDALNGLSLPETLRQQFGVPFTLIYMVISLFVIIGIFNLIMAVFLDKVLNEHVARELNELGLRSDEMEEYISTVIGALAEGRRLPLRNKSFVQKLCDSMRRKRNAHDPVNHRFSMLAKVNKDLEVSRECFNKWLEYPEMIEMLRECHVETATKYELFDLLDADISGALGFRELVHGLMRLRGPITKADIVSIDLKVHHLAQMVGLE